MTAKTAGTPKRSEKFMDAVLDCELKLRRYVYLKMKCVDRKFDENAVYAQLLTWHDGMDYSNY